MSQQPAHSQPVDSSTDQIARLVQRGRRLHSQAMAETLRGLVRALMPVRTRHAGAPVLTPSKTAA